MNTSNTAAPATPTPPDTASADDDASTANAAAAVSVGAQTRQAPEAPENQSRAFSVLGDVFSGRAKPPAEPVFSSHCGSAGGFALPSIRVHLNRKCSGNWTAHLARGLLAAGAAACALFSVPPAAGLLAGACIALLFGNPVSKLTHKWSGLVLQIAVVLLGAEMNLGVVWRVGAGGVGYTLAGIALAMAAGLWIGRRFGLERDVALLISAGTAICGGSAIAAVSAANKPKAHDVAVSLGSIFFLTALGMLVFPLLGRALGFSQEQFGMWSALALHDTSSVVGAATAYGTTALGIAVTVKLTRALWIVPLTAAMAWWHEKKAAGKNPPQHHEARTGKAAWRRLVPQPFIICYLAVAAVFTYAPAWAPALGGALRQAAPWCGLGAHRFLTLALFLIGAGLSRETLRRTGVRPLKMAFVLWCFVSAVTAAALWAGWIVAPKM